jgi:DNA integrity scanning protein DisA with diadenylate cyclase activity
MFTAAVVVVMMTVIVVMAVMFMAAGTSFGFFLFRQNKYRFYHCDAFSENIFFKNSPLHDGAMIIRHKQIIAAGCILPVSHDLNIPKELGLRHRAAMGVSQETDALAIIVSEETGGISVAYKGQFHLRLTAEELERILTKED